MAYHPASIGGSHIYNSHSQFDSSRIHPASIGSTFDPSKYPPIKMEEGNNIPTSPTKDILPSYQTTMNEKSPIEVYGERNDVEVESGKYDPESTGLVVGGGKSTIREKVNKLSKVKKAFLALAVVYFTFVLTHKAAGALAGGHHGHHKHHGIQPWREVAPGPFAPCDGLTHDQMPENFNIVPTVYGTALTLEGEQKTANATFSIPFNRRKGLNINFKGLEGNVIISRSDITSESRHSPSELIVESLFEGDVSGVEMKAGEWFDELTINSEDAIGHRIHLVLPSQKHRLPSLTISSTNSINFELATSAQDLIFKDLTLKSETGDINVPSLVGGKINLDAVAGTIGGTYNVSQALVLKTVTGNIDAKVHVIAPWHGPHHRPPPPHKGKGKHGPKHEHDNDDDEEDHKHKSEHHDGSDDEDEEKKHEHHKRNKKHSKKGKKEHKKRKHHDHHKKDKRSWLSKWFGKFERPSHPHPPPPPPPRPAFIGAFSTTGSVNLTVLSQGNYTSSIIKAISKTNNVSVQHAENFRGLYEISSFVGNYSLSIPEKYKDHHILEQFVGEKGGKEKGLVGFKRPKGQHSPENNQPPSKGHNLDKRDEGEDEMEDWIDIFQFSDVEEEIESTPAPPKGDHPPPPPPHKGPGGPGGPPPPPHKGPGGPPSPPHGPPGSPPPHGPPGKHHPPPPPPHGPPKGPGGPGGPGRPHGPPHLPPGHSRVLAHTDIGNVQLVL
ncbi:uncharacterized protein I206_101177 [Kwoniella pini CBS 10737]|uniref:Adhesin domain-containing protein n=1 Tax=Kwoniella pini CBS 10737 TaxID=1296096 RepID=A0A1B9IBS1_9TREE|nr:uncharacterized protein I206_00148 [Kwoniella pini CBS 10737]OCF52850.1 hypothetical protein I206_00148 [Kwoniella pini CBS 10737]